jgi:hypothetical protein
MYIHTKRLTPRSFKYLTLNTLGGIRTHDLMFQVRGRGSPEPRCQGAFLLMKRPPYVHTPYVYPYGSC